LVVISIINIIMLLEVEESELVLPVTDFVTERNPTGFAEISVLKVSVKLADVALDF
jgi:hypothetical protein